METRETVLIQVKVYVLFLNLMREKAEIVRAVAASFDREKLESWYEQQKAEEKYRVEEDGHSYLHTFKEDSDLYWYNPYETVSAFGDAGIQEHWVIEEFIDDIRYMMKFVE